MFRHIALAAVCAVAFLAAPVAFAQAPGKCACPQGTCACALKGPCACKAAIAPVAPVAPAPVVGIGTIVPVVPPGFVAVPVVKYKAVPYTKRVRVRYACGCHYSYKWVNKTYYKQVPFTAFEVVAVPVPVAVPVVPHGHLPPGPRVQP